jgi:hypothetical protein
MYFVATCIIAPKKGVASAGILSTIDSKALEEVEYKRKVTPMRSSPAMHPPEVLRHPDQRHGECQEQ